MFSTKTRVTAILFFVLVIICLIFGFMWWNTKKDLKNTQAELDNANAQIMVLKEDNDRLVEYNNRKNEEIKDLENKYKEKLKNIPKDSCGDMKPSKELMEYFRSL